VKPCRGADDQALLQQAVQVLGHHLDLHVVIDELGLFLFALDQAARRQPGQGLGGSQGFQQPGLPLRHHLVKSGQPGAKLRFGKNALLMRREEGQGGKSLQVVPGFLFQERAVEGRLGEDIVVLLVVFVEMAEKDPGHPAGAGREGGAEGFMVSRGFAPRAEGTAVAVSRPT
jgi:hypothetical protein